MKNKLLLALLLSFSSIAVSGERCTLKVVKYAQAVNRHIPTKIKKVITLPSAQSCFNKAIELSKKYPVYKGEIEHFQDFLSYRRIDTDIYPYVTWEFNDGYFDDSDGKVNNLTKKNRTDFSLGNMVYDKDGYEIQ